MRSHQADEAALEQWKPLIEKFSFKAARRAAAINAPYDADDFRQILRMTVLRAMDSFDPEKGVKFITFLYSAFFHEINKTLRTCQANVEQGYTISGNASFSKDSDGGDQAWDYIEDDQERSPEHSYMDMDLLQHVHRTVSEDASIALRMLMSGNPFVTQQMEAYNYGIDQDAQQGGMRRYQLDLNFQFICKLLGYSSSKVVKLSNQINDAIKTYGEV